MQEKAHWYHEWRVISDDAAGYFEKQEGQKDSRLIVPGTVLACKKCPKMILEPKDLRLKTVEVTPGD